MNDDRHDLLDTLAVLVGGGRSPRRGPGPRPGEPGPTEERFTRSSAAKLALAGLVSISVGATRVSPALASARDDCLDTCYTKYVNAADRQANACMRRFGGDPKSIFRTKRGGWGRFKVVLDRGGVSTLTDLVMQLLRENCELIAIRRMENGFGRCQDACRETCPEPGGRSPSSFGARASTCRGTNPPPPYTPSVPPPPSAAPPPSPPSSAVDDYCGRGGACEQVGGKCCGPPSGIPGINTCVHESQCES